MTYRYRLRIICVFLCFFFTLWPFDEFAKFSIWHGNILQYLTISYNKRYWIMVSCSFVILSHWPINKYIHKTVKTEIKWYIRCQRYCWLLWDFFKLKIASQHLLSEEKKYPNNFHRISSVKFDYSTSEMIVSCSTMAFQFFSTLWQIYES